MNVIYATMHGTSEKISFPSEMDMEGKGCALFEITGNVSPYADIPLFLCADFLQDSIVSARRTLPVLHRISLKRDEKDPPRGLIDQVFYKMLWLPTNRSPVKEIRLYLTDMTGDPAPFAQCTIHCTLVCIPHVDKL